MARPVTRRYFLGLQPPEAIRSQLELLCHTGQFGQGPFHHPLDWHLTLAFLGESEQAPETIMAQLTRIESPVFELCLDQLDYWPKPRVLVLCPEHPPQALFTLVDALWQGLAPLGFKPEQRPYRPHLTLGRRAGQPERHPWSMATKVCWQVDGFGLFVSDRSCPAPRYQVLAKKTFRQA